MTIQLRDLFALTPDLNEKVILSLLTAVKEGQDTSFDYLKFKQSYKSLLSMGMDEATAAKSAYVTASTMGLTKDKLIESVRHYKSILAKERESFAQALKKQITNNVDAKSAEIVRLKEKFEENIRKIEQIQKEQVVIETMVTDLEQASTVAQGKINETRDQFKLTFDTIYKELEEDESLYDQILS